MKVSNEFGSYKLILFNKAENFRQIFFDFWVSETPEFNKTKIISMVGGSKAKYF